MGSSGSGHLSDYPGDKPVKISGSGGRSGTTGGSAGGDICDHAFSTELEDFERSEWHAKHKGAPPTKGTVVKIEKAKRLIARASSGESIGNIPTAFNYLVGCMAEGRTYEGRVTNVSPGLVTKIQIDIAPK